MGIDVDADAFTADIERAIDEVDDLEEQWSGGTIWTVGTAVNYAIYLEFGTRDMDPKPFLRPAVAEARASLETFIATNTRTTLDAIDSADELVRIVALALERRVKEIITEKGLIDTGTLRASVAAIPVADASALPSADDVGFDDEGRAIDAAPTARAQFSV
jgi:hypothetical protein